MKMMVWLPLSSRRCTLSCGSERAVRVGSSGPGGHVALCSSSISLRVLSRVVDKLRPCISCHSDQKLERVIL
jgi:hypothetical protein